MTVQDSPDNSRPWLALQAMLTVQVLASMTLSAASVLSPAVAPSLGMAPERVGLFVATSYLLAMLSGLPTGRWVARWGGIRVSQGALLCLAAGAVLACLGQGWSFILAAGLIGVGYGLANPSAAAVLARHVPRQASGLFFSMKQAGVPIGVALAGLCMPLGLAWVGWQWTAILAATVCLLAAVSLLATVSRLDRPEWRQGLTVNTRWWAPLQEVWRTPALRQLGLISLIYAMAQQGFVTFLVSLLHLQGGMPLATAAGILAASQLASTAARVGFGHLADRWMAPARLLGWLGVGMSLCLVLLAAVGVDGQVLLCTLGALACGIFAMGWNGVFFAELVNCVPRERLPNAAGATQFFTFTGGMCGPFLIGQFVGWGGSYGQGMLLLAAFPITGGVLMLRAQRRRAASARP